MRGRDECGVGKGGGDRSELSIRDCRLLLTAPKFRSACVIGFCKSLV